MDNDGTQAGPLMERFTLDDGTTILLPAGTKLLPTIKPEDFKPVDTDEVSLGGTFY